MRRTFYLGIVCAFLLPVLIVSCSQDYEVEPPESTQIDAEHLDIISRMGFDISSIIEYDEYYVVEEDIMLFKEYINDYLPENGTRQAMHKNGLIPFQNVLNITYQVNSAVPSQWATAIHNATAAWSGVSQAYIRFQQVSSGGHLIFSMVNTNEGFIAQASFPSSNKAGTSVKINNLYANTYNVDQKTSVMVHEIGHVLGFYHTDWESLTGHNNGKHIEGTPHTDPFSVMNHSYSGWGWSTRGFSNNDLVAINKLYGFKTPRLSGPTKSKVFQTASFYASIDNVVYNNWDWEWSVTGNDYTIINNKNDGNFSAKFNKTGSYKIGCRYKVNGKWSDWTYSTISVTDDYPTVSGPTNSIVAPGKTLWFSAHCGYLSATYDWKVLGNCTVLQIRGNEIQIRFDNEGICQVMCRYINNGYTSIYGAYAVTVSRNPNVDPGLPITPVD